MLLANDVNYILFEDEHSQMSVTYGSYTKDIVGTKLYRLYELLFYGMDENWEQPGSTSGWEIKIVSDSLYSWLTLNKPTEVCNEVNCNTQKQLYEFMNHYVLRAIRLPKGFKLLKGTTFDFLQGVLKNRDLDPKF